MNPCRLCIYRSDRKCRLLDWTVLNEYTVSNLGSEINAKSEQIKKYVRWPLRNERTSEIRESAWKRD